MKRKIFIWISALVLFGSLSAFADTNEIYIINIAGTINPGVADFVKSGIEKANNENISCVIVSLDTPGGLAESMRAIVMAILGSKVPVVVYVSPSGARAASAGVIITLAADIAAMAPGTNIGAAHPVGLGGKDIGGSMSEKVINDMVAYAQSIAKKRHRNAEWVEKAIRQSVSITETEALKEKVIDIVAHDLDDLVQQINGRKVDGKGELRLDRAVRKVLKESLRTKILKTISNPNIAYLLLMIGVAGLYFELANPGAIFPGVVGGIALILAAYSLQTLPVNYAGILLIVLALILFIMEIKITSYGLLSVAGVVSLLLGSFMLFEKGIPGFGLSWKVFLPTIILISGFFVVVTGLIVKSQVSQPRTGERGLVGEIGVVRKAIMPKGKVFVHGELWNATSQQPIPEGASVRVISVKNLLLEVEWVEK